MNETPNAESVCSDICTRQATVQLLSRLRPDACICAHGVRRTLDDLYPSADITQMRSSALRCRGCGCASDGTLGHTHVRRPTESSQR